MNTALLEQSTVAGEDEVRRFLNEIRHYPLLTAQQERELAMACAAGDEDAVCKMVNSNLRLVVSVAREYALWGVPLLDLVQEGSIGLLNAARKFDYTLEYRFSTYATKWIRQGITRCLMNYSLIRVPGHTAEQIRKVLTAKHMLHQQLGTEPTERQIAQQCGIPEEKVRKLLLLNPELCSLDVPVGEDDGSFGSLIEDTGATQPYEQLVRHALDRTMHTLLSMLDERQQRVLRLYFGMEDGVCYSLGQIGAKLGISKERARQIEHQAMEKLQQLGASMGLEEYLD